MTLSMTSSCDVGGPIDVAPPPCEVISLYLCAKWDSCGLRVRNCKELMTGLCTNGQYDVDFCLEDIDRSDCSTLVPSTCRDMWFPCIEKL